MLSEQGYQCKTCGSAEGCLCRLGDKAAPPEKVVAETERDFTELPEGSRVRRPRGVVVRCPLCDKLGVHVVIPKWRRRPAREQWIHEARVSNVGYEVLDSCERDKPVKRGRR